MNKLTKSTKNKDIERTWHLVDLKNKILGRESTVIAKYLIGKSKKYYIPNLDCGDFVVVINCEKVKLTGKKEKNKIYMRFSGYPSGLKRKTFDIVRNENPKRIIIQAVSGMLPKNKLRKSMLKRLFVYIGEKHPYFNKFKSHNL
jgi:large subunit ribosomal protein L13